MKHLSTIPICSNALFIYKLNIKNNLTSKFKKEKFRSVQFTPAFEIPSLIGEDFNILKKYPELNREIHLAVDATLQKMLMLPHITYRIYNSWLTKVIPKGSSLSHNHSNSWLSGIYYPQSDPGFSVKLFHDVNLPFHTPPTEYNIYNSKEWEIIPEDNALILFFSPLRHQIMPNQSTKERVSLAFNLLPTGEFGASDSKVVFK